ncbi:hypothetical protein L195_g045443 [Trifolium pratense]|uniref:Uncharacterized protein n=1 Tax=Trifolium pratense TaxID=57577 RepID=A0A2K3MEX2_TRIPR|nr:hypothetical protein L195_g045443 [Trifolium pratense]
MVGNGNFHANLRVLDGKNWNRWMHLWLAQMKVIFGVQEVYEQVTNGMEVVEPLPANLTYAQRSAYKEAKKNC